MDDFYFNFEGKEYKAKLTIKKNITLDLYYVSVRDQNLLQHFRGTYLFGYVSSIGVQHLSAFLHPENVPLVESLCAAVRDYIEAESFKDKVEK